MRQGLLGQLGAGRATRLRPGLRGMTDVGDPLARIRDLEQQLAAAKAAQAEGSGGIGYLARPLTASQVEYLRPGDYPHTLNSDVLPRDGIGQLGEPYVLSLPQDPVWAHALSVRRKQAAVTYQQSVSVESYLELVNEALGGSSAALAAEDERLSWAAEELPNLVPTPTLPTEPTDEQQAAYEAAVEKRKRILEAVQGAARAIEPEVRELVRAANSTAKILEIASYSTSLQRAELAPEHLLPEPVRAAIKAQSQAATGFVVTNPTLARLVSSFNAEHAKQAAKAAATKTVYGPTKGAGRGKGKAEPSRKETTGSGAKSGAGSGAKAPSA